MGMFEDLLSGNLSSDSVNADSLQIDAINIAYKKLELKFTKLTTANTIYIQAVINLLIEKGIFTKEEFANAIDKEAEKGEELNKLIKTLEKQIKEMEEKFAKDSAEIMKQNAEMMEFYDLLMGKNKKEEKKEDKDGE